MLNDCTPTATHSNPRMYDHNDRPTDGHETGSKRIDDQPAQRLHQTQQGPVMTDGGEPVDENDTDDGSDEERRDETTGAESADPGPGVKPQASTEEATSTPVDEDAQAETLSLTPSVRSFVKADRDHECELCGTSKEDATKLHIHHRIPQADGGTDHPSNLIVLCQACHERHHGNEPIEQRLAKRANGGAMSTDMPADPAATDDAGTRDRPQDSATETNGAKNVDEPLPPRSEPNGADKEILSLLEAQGPLSTGEIAAQTDYSKQYVRRQCWKLSGEQLVAPRTDNTWDLEERTDTDTRRIGLPDDPNRARRAGRDEVIRQLSAHGMGHAQIADITNLSRSTIDIAVNRARALQLEDTDAEEVTLATIATRLSALLELIDHVQIDTPTGG